MLVAPAMQPRLSATLLRARSLVAAAFAAFALLAGPAMAKADVPSPAAAGFGARQITKNADLGLPTRASVRKPNDYLMIRHGYVGSYNAARLEPNWIAYKVTPDTYRSPEAWLERQPKFRQDPQLPPQIRQPIQRDYLGTGYDRGHEKRAGDAPMNAGENKATYQWSNVVPQARSVNQGPWNQFENYYRDVAMREHKDVRVVVGNLYEGASRTVGESKVAVPSHLFKIIAISDHGTRAAEMSPKNTRFLAVLMPNDDAAVGMKDNFAKYVVSPTSLVRRTGWTDMLSGVPHQVRGALVEKAPEVKRVDGGYTVDGALVLDPK